jgi:cation diffusion facilitator CzcD-associated flavoprotein CzcO
MLDWLIIGGGIHGTHLSLFLTQRKRVPPDRLRVLDPYPEPLMLWTHHTANTGMAFLRSSHAHNLHYDPFSLATFARTRRGEPLADFIDSYARPAFDLFMAHSFHLIDRYKLDQLRITGRAVGLTRLRDGWRVETADGGIEARRVVIAIGNTENPHWPDWALPLRESGAPIHHIFDVNFDRDSLPPWTQAVVVGGGITAAQTALAMAVEQPGTVTLVMRHPIRVHDFDSDPAWVGVNRIEFQQESNYASRRAIIAAARHRGSMPPDVARELRAAVEQGILSLQTGEIINTELISDSSLPLNLALSTQHLALSADRLILATGFKPNRPGGLWLDQAVTDYNLPLAPDGYPIVDETLRWGDGLYVTGPLAELEIGPVSRNFIGVRLAAECIGAQI